MRHHRGSCAIVAAIAALLLYRGMLTFAGLDNRAIFALSVSVAAVGAVAWMAVHLLWPLRRE